MLKVIQDGVADEDDATSRMLDHEHGLDRYLRDTGSCPPALGTLVQDLNRCGPDPAARFKQTAKNFDLKFLED